MDLVSGSVVDFVESLGGPLSGAENPNAAAKLWMRVKLWYLNYNFASG